MLEHHERTVFAYFLSVEDAHHAEIELKQNGYKDVKVDRVHTHLASHDDGTSPTLSSAQSLTGLTLDRSPDDNARVLLGADPMVSGLSAAVDYQVSDAYLVTVVTDDEGVEEVERVLKKYGGML